MLGARILFLGLLILERDEHLVNPGAVHVYYLKVETVPLRALAGLRYALHLLYDQTRQGVIVLLFAVVKFLLVEIRKEVVERALAVDEPALRVLALYDLGVTANLVDVADEAFEYVAQRNYALETAEDASEPSG